MEIDKPVSIKGLVIHATPAAQIIYRKVHCLLKLKHLHPPTPSPFTFTTYITAPLSAANRDMRSSNSSSKREPNSTWDTLSTGGSEESKYDWNMDESKDWVGSTGPSWARNEGRKSSDLTTLYDFCSGWMALPSMSTIKQVGEKTWRNW